VGRGRFVVHSSMQFVLIGVHDLQFLQFCERISRVPTQLSITFLSVLTHRSNPTQPGTARPYSKLVTIRRPYQPGPAFFSLFFDIFHFDYQKLN